LVFTLGKDKVSWVQHQISMMVSQSCHNTPGSTSLTSQREEGHLYAKQTNCQSLRIVTDAWNPLQ